LRIQLAFEGSDLFAQIGHLPIGHAIVLDHERRREASAYNPHATRTYHPKDQRWASSAIHAPTPKLRCTTANGRISAVDLLKSICLLLLQRRQLLLELSDPPIFLPAIDSPCPSAVRCCSAESTDQPLRRGSAPDGRLRPSKLLPEFVAASRQLFRPCMGELVRLNQLSAGRLVTPKLTRLNGRPRCVTDARRQRAAGFRPSTS
jgi:hypothetical protein